MTLENCAMLLAIIKELYPHEKAASNPNVKVKAWYNVLKDYEFSEGELAVYNFAKQDTKGFAPVPGQIIEQIMSLRMIRQGDLIEMEAWHLVVKAVQRSAYDSESEFEKLPLEVRRAVGSPEQLKIWSRLDSNDFNTVTQSNFMRSYRLAVSQRDKMTALGENSNYLFGKDVLKIAQ